MHARVALFAAIAATTLCMTAAAVSADATSVPPGTVIVPPAWAGIWDVVEETTSGTPPAPHPAGQAPACEGGPVTTRSYRDTLCAGDTMQVFSPPYPNGPQLSCSGPGFTDTALKLNCFNFMDCNSCCPPEGPVIYTFFWDAAWSLSGDVATTSVTYSSYVSNSPPCASSSSCTKTTSTRTRVSNRCDLVVPARRLSWGTLKLLYR